MVRCKQQRPGCAARAPTGVNGGNTMQHSWHILSFDSDAVWRTRVNQYLLVHGYSTSTAFSERDLWRKLDSSAVDLLLLGPNGRGETDFQLLSELRAAISLPLIVSDAVAEDAERIIALELGADDHLRRPFDPRELLARIRCLQRRCARVQGTATAPPVVYKFAGWTFVPERAELSSPRGHEVRLTTSERRMLQALVKAPCRVLSRERLLRVAADPGREVSDRSIDMMIWRLRRKLDPALIRTERSAGYLFSARVEHSVRAQTLVGAERAGTVR